MAVEFQTCTVQLTNVTATIKSAIAKQTKWRSEKQKKSKIKINEKKKKNRLTNF